MVVLSSVNGLGSHTEVSGAPSYVNNFDIWLAYEELLRTETFDINNPSAFYLMQMTHMTAFYAD